MELQKKDFYPVVASQTAIGPKSRCNHDSLVTVVPQDTQVMTRKGALFVVADGWLYSDVSNQITVDTIEAAYYQESEQTLPDALVQALQQANVQLFQRIEAMRLEWEGTSTCTAAVLYGDIIYGAHIGESRAYLVRQGQIQQLTQDHTVAAELVRAGQLPPQALRTHPRRSLITRTALGATHKHDIVIDTFVESVQAGDHLVLCTDGLWYLVDDNEICTIVEQNEPQQSAHYLIQLANERVRQDDMADVDDITVIVVKITL